MPDTTPHRLGAVMTGANSDSARVPFDFYPTPPEATHALLDFLEGKDLLSPKRPGMIWEPACGDGAMVRVLEGRGYACLASDIRETGFGDGHRDFLQEPRLAPMCDAIITNPPFNLAEKFLTHARALKPGLICLLLKATYWHTQARSRWFHDNHVDPPKPVRPDWVLPIGWRLAFQPERGSAPVMDCSWFVWTLNSRRETCGYHPLPPLTTQEALL
ncbi:MAG: hypothetical protein Alpg2KO_14440 [Alphaproteobacteria bacterium]